ncbi:MAG TPA: hypothetical protein VKY45_00040 [Marinilabiliaceae bacterium]|nr:hypothetical protein [Marinilabiliaceae bacterium]
MLIILVAVGILIYYFANNLINNTYLAVAGFLLISGIAVHIIVNRAIDDV